MTSAELERLVGIGQLKREPPSRREYDGLLRSGQVRLADAAKDSLSPDSRFDLAYNAAHALSLAALRRLGYRSENRYIVFQTLHHTLGIPPERWRVLDMAHRKRNQSEYGGSTEVDARLLTDLIDAARVVLTALESVEPPGSDE